MAGPVNEQEQLTPEQWAFLSQFSADYIAGKRFLCWAARAIVGIGIFAGSIAAIVTAYHAIWPR